MFAELEDWVESLDLGRVDGGEVAEEEVGGFFGGAGALLFWRILRPVRRERRHTDGRGSDIIRFADGW
jgi:hypothetical protein